MTGTGTSGPYSATRASASTPNSSSACSASCCSRSRCSARAISVPCAVFTTVSRSAASSRTRTRTNFSSAAPPLLTARTAGNRVELRVVDHGPGIAAADRKRVFQPFCRLGALGDSTGVGLGLAVARGLAETMGGTVEPEDTPGGGLTMVLTLPAAPARPAAESCGTRRIRVA